MQIVMTMIMIGQVAIVIRSAYQLTNRLTALLLLLFFLLFFIYIKPFSSSMTCGRFMTKFGYQLLVFALTFSIESHFIDVVWIPFPQSPITFIHSNIFFFFDRANLGTHNQSLLHINVLELLYSTYSAHRLTY